jgi:redox-sensitive bicupin YhaK (pirin superfamily)
MLIFNHFIVTYQLKGTFSHEDSKGNKGILHAGDLQWMTAGKGVVHSEMPVGHEPTRGLQLWVNLAKQYKMVEPQYQELKDQQIPRTSQNGVHVKVIAGRSMNVTSPVYTRTPMMYLDFKVDRGGSYSQEIPRHWNGFIYILEGSGAFGPNENLITASKRQTVLLTKEDGDFISFRNDNTEQLHFVLIAGQPLNEPVVQHGPFVMNTQAEIEQTFQDYQLGRNGFEGARNWQSEYTKGTRR